MALSSGGWAPPASVPASSQQLVCGGSAATPCCSTVLMSVRVSVCHSGIRPLCLPGAGSEALRLQLSMDPSRAGEFRLALRDMSGNRSVVRFERCLLATCLIKQGRFITSPMVDLSYGSDNVLCLASITQHRLEMSGRPRTDFIWYRIVLFCPSVFS